METRIQEAEERLASLSAESARPESSANSARLIELTREMGIVQAEIDRLYARWAELES